MTTREEQFRQWLGDKSRQTVKPLEYGTGLGDMQAMIEDMLFSAYEAGYEDCLANVRDKLNVLGAGTALPGTVVKAD